MSKKILAGQVWQLTKAAQERAQSELEVVDPDIKFTRNVTVTGFTMDEKFEVEDLSAQSPYVFGIDDFERFVSHAPKEEEFEDDEDDHLSAPNYYDN